MKKIFENGLKSLKTGGKLVVGAMLIASSTMVYSVLAAPPGTPYNLGETLQPGCAPGDANCTVVTPAASGVNGDITELTGLTTPLSVPQGGTGQSTWSADGILYALDATTLAQLSLDPLLSVVGGILFVDSTVMVEGENISLLTNDSGYARLGSADVITADWDNTANPWAANELVSNVMLETENVSLLTNDANYVALGDNVSGLTNDANYVALGDNVSGLTNDALYITNAGETDQVWVAAEPNYANLGQAETISADWDNTANPWAANEITEADPIFGASAVQTWWTTLGGAPISSLNNDSGFISNAGETDQVWVAAEPNYANLGQAETITADWVNTANPWAANEITEADPVFGISAAAGITGGNITTWNSAIQPNTSPTLTDLNITAVLNLVPQASPPGSPTDGDIYIDNSVLRTMCVYNGGTAAWTDINAGTQPGNCA